jgi:hypothetical protein
MRRILLSCASVMVLLLPAAASAGAHAHTRPGFLVVRRAGGGGIYGHAVVTVVVKGFVLGRVSPHGEARIDVYHLPSVAGGGPRATPDVSVRPVRWRSFSGTEFSGSGFRFRGMGGFYRVVVRGSGIYIFAGGHGSVTLHGSSVFPRADGTYSVDGRAFRSLPSRSLKRQIGGS